MGNCRLNESCTYTSRARIWHNIKLLNDPECTFGVKGITFADAHEANRVGAIDGNERCVAWRGDKTLTELRRPCKIHIEML